MDQQEYKDGKYDAFSIWVPNCQFRGFCITRDNVTTTFCPCVVRVGMQELDNNVKVYCDLAKQLEEPHEGV